MLKMMMSALQGEEGSGGIGARVVATFSFDATTLPESPPTVEYIEEGERRPAAVSSPISTSRKDAGDSSSSSEDEEDPSPDGNQTRSDDLILPDIREDYYAMDDDDAVTIVRSTCSPPLSLRSKDAFCTTVTSPASEAAAHVTETWDERIQREIEAAQRAAAAALAHHNPVMLSMVSSQQQQQQQEPDLMQTDESMTSIDSYEILQNFAVNDPIAKQRLLSCDSKDDIDLAYSRSSTANLRLEQSIVQESGSMNQHQRLLQPVPSHKEGLTPVVPEEHTDVEQNFSLVEVQSNIPLQPLESHVATPKVRNVPPLEFSSSTEISLSDHATTQDVTSPNNSTGSIIGMSLLPESPEQRYRRRHFITENDGTGEGISVVGAFVPKGVLQRDSTEKKSNVSYKPGSLLDDEQSSCSERPRRQLLQTDRRFHRPSIEPSRKPNAEIATPHPSHHQTQQQQHKKPSIEPICATASQEKKDSDDPSLSNNADRHARFVSKQPSLRVEDDSFDELRECLSATESEVASFDGLPSGLQKRWLLGEAPREKMLQSLDGIHYVPKRSEHDPQIFSSAPPQLVHAIGGKERDESMDQEEDALCDGPVFADCFDFSNWGVPDRPKCGTKGHWRTSSWKQQHDVPLAILDCANIINQEERAHAQAPRVQTSLVRVASDFPNPSYAETILPTEVDPRMQDWIASQYAFRDRPPRDGSYHLGKSRTVIVHEIFRGNWTWCTAWSPDGALLAVATDNHHLAVVDTTSSTVWRVRHDRKIRGPQKSNTTQSIRAIAWGANYIAIGGTGNAVSILSPTEPYEILLTITATGFVGCLHWRGESNVLAIGSRLDFVMIVRICETDEDSTVHGGKQLKSDILHRIEYKYWVNTVSFSPDGSCLAVGDSGGIVSVYDYEESEKVVETNMITWFKRKDSILTIEWSPDGKWLYAGGEDRSVTVIDTTYWEIVHRIGHDRWVQCIAASYGGTHVAIGGVSSEISILDVANGWDSVMGIELKGLVPLSAKWHPRDQYLVVTGQDNSIIAVETTNARHVKGHHLHSISPIRAIEFSPDGRMAIIGNEAGVVTFFSLSGTTFITAYELIIPLNTSICIQWSLNGMFVVVGSMSSFMVVWRKRNKRQGKKCPPNASGFSVKRVISEFGPTHAVSIDFQSQYVAVSGDCTRILDAKADFATVREWTKGPYYANAWSPDGRWLAMIGKEKFLTIYDTSSKRVDRWRAIFSMKCDFVGRALSWGPLIVGGLLYLAYGGDSNEIYIMEIRTREGTWETVLRVPRDASVNALDWSMDGLLAAGIGNGTVSIVDLAYLQSGVAVNEMDYNWQRQALTCFTEIRRNRGDNSIKSLRWLPAAPGSDRLLAVGGTDGEVEIIDLTERRRCKGYARYT